MKLNPTTTRLPINALIALIILLFGVPIAASAQLSIGLTTAPALQTLVISEATITEGYQVRLLPQLGVQLAYGVGERTDIRGAVSYEMQGARYESTPATGQPYAHYWSNYRVDYAKASLGVSYRVPIAERLALGGALDLVGGLPTFFKIHYKIDDVEDYSETGSAKIFNPYVGLDLGLSLQYALPSDIRLRFAPTFQSQLNSAAESSLELHWVGFAPRLEVVFPLTHQ